jgi:hypothetical protein
MTHIKDYIKENRDRFMDELFGYLRIPSISSKSEHKPDMEKAAQYLKEQLEKAGVDKAEVCASDGNPVVMVKKLLTLHYQQFWYMVTMMLCQQSHWKNGNQNHLSQKSEMEKFMHVAPMMIKDRQ